MRKNLQILSFVILLFLSGSAMGQVSFYVLEPPSIEGAYDFRYPDASSGWGFDLDNMAPVVDTLALVDDGTLEDSLGCNSLVNTGDIQGKIAVVYRGSCQFGTKALNAQVAGAVAVIIINNAPGAPIVPGAGTVGGSVTIPTIMVSDLTGALLRTAMASGSVVAFIGNKQGFFPNDLGFAMKDIILARSWATHQDATADTAYQIPLGAWVYNRGSAAQTGVVLNATISKGGTTLYNQTSAGVSLAIGDSAFITLPTYNQSPYDTGYYELTYTAASSVTDDFANDNMVTTNFWVNDTWVSKGRMDPATGTMLGGGGAYRPSSSIVYNWCITLNEQNYGGLSAQAVQFALTAGTGDSLTGKTVQVEIHEWLNKDGADVTADSVIEIGTGIYEYASNLTGQFITVPFTSPVTLDDDMRYLVCVHVFNDLVYLVTDAEMDYNASIYYGYGEWQNPINTTDWFAAGFGTDLVPAIGLQVQRSIGVDEKEDVSDVKAYPNPATEFVAIPISAGKYDVRVVDVSGKLVHKGSYTVANNELRINTTEITNGVYYFSVTGDDNKTRTFSVVITK